MEFINNFINNSVGWPVAIFFMVGWVAVLIAPLFIWKHTSRTADYLCYQNEILRGIKEELERTNARKKD